MIQPLRTAHGWIFIMLAVIMTALLIVAIRAQRQPIPNDPGVQAPTGSRP